MVPTVVPGLVRKASFEGAMVSPSIGAFRLQELGQAEVENFGGAAIGDKHVGGLDVAMNDAFFVRGIEGVGDLNAESDRSRNRQRAAGEHFFQRLAFEQFHGDERPAFVFFDGVDGANSGMVQGGGGTRLAQEALDGRGVFGAAILQEFQRDAPAQSGVFGFVDEAHAAAAKLAKNAIVTDRLVDHRGTWRRRKNVALRY